MKILVLGGDKYCGWPPALHLSGAGHDVVVDNFARRQIDHELGAVLPKVSWRSGRERRDGADSSACTPVL